MRTGSRTGTIRSGILPNLQMYVELFLTAYLLSCHARFWACALRLFSTVCPGRIWVWSLVYFLAKSKPKYTQKIMSVPRREWTLNSSHTWWEWADIVRERELHFMTQDKYQNRVKLEQNPDYSEHPSVDLDVPVLLVSQPNRRRVSSSLHHPFTSSCSFVCQFVNLWCSWFLQSISRWWFSLLRLDLCHWS